MWALRRASNNYFKATGLKTAAFRTCAGLRSVSSHKDDKSSSYDPRMFKIDSWATSKTCNSTVRAPQKFSVGCRCFSSQADANVGEKEIDEVEDGFSDSETIEGDLVEGENTSGSTSSIYLSSKAFTPSPLLKVILEVSGRSITGALDKYFMGKELDRFELYKSMLTLRRMKLFKKALQLTEWLKRRSDFDFTERDYTNMLDLIAKVRGHQQAESYINDIPECFRQELAYRTLLANYVSATLVTKSENLFNQMKNLGFPITSFTCNQLLLLYKRIDKRKISEVLSLMQKKNLKRTPFTYQVLIDVKGTARDILGMNLLVEEMKAEGLEPSVRLQGNLAMHYAAAGYASKAESVLRDLESDDLLKNSHFIRSLVLPVYANIGNYEEVDRIWKVAESRSPNQAEFLAGIGAYGKLKNVKQAEAIFSEMKQNYKKVTSRHYTAMLQVYAENKMLSQGKELLKQMAEDGCCIGPLAWDALVKLYVDVGEVGKADSVLESAIEQDKYLKPMFTSYMAILHAYSKRGDVHNAERIYQKMRLAGYVSRAQPLCVLVQTYINAKVPAYGMRDRMKGDNILPNKGLATQLALLESFYETTESKLIESAPC